MTFAAPLNLLWLLPALGAIVALYLLRRPRRNIVVPSTIFWRMLPEQSVRATRLQRFAPELLFFLQALAALLIVASAAHPSVRSPVVVGRTWAVIIDNGSSMNATDIAPTRLASAISRAQQIIRQLPARDQAILITTANIAHAILPANTRRETATAAIGNIAPTDSRSDIPGAVSVAANALKQTAKRGRVGGILMFGDGAWPQSADIAIAKAAQEMPLQLVQIGSGAAANIAVSRLSVERDPSSPETTLDALVQIDSHSDTAIQPQLTVSLEGQAVARQSISLTPNATQQATFKFRSPNQPSILTAHLTGQGRDNLPDDDTAWAILPAAGTKRVLLISQGDAPLERALSLLPGVKVNEARSSGSGYVPRPGSYDAYIFDDVAPPPLGSVPGNALVFGGAAPDFVTTVGSTSDSEGHVVTWNRSHPVDRFVDFSSTNLRAPAWKSVGSWQPLMEMQNGIVGAVQDRQGRRDAWFSFSPQASGISSQIVFPILVSNMIDWLTQISGQSDVAGAPITLAPTKSGWVVSGPDGIHASGLCTIGGIGCTFTDTLTAGVYKAQSSSGTLLFTRNANPTASDIRPQSHQFSSSALLLGADSDPSRVSWSDITGSAAAICLLLLALEWWVYHRPIKRAVRSQSYRG